MPATNHRCYQIAKTSRRHNRRVARHTILKAQVASLSAENTRLNGELYEAGQLIGEFQAADRHRARKGTREYQEALLDLFGMRASYLRPVGDPSLSVMARALRDAEPFTEIGFDFEVWLQFARCYPFLLDGLSPEAWVQATFERARDFFAATTTTPPPRTEITPDEPVRASGDKRYVMPDHGKLERPGEVVSGEMPLPRQHRQNVQDPLFPGSALDRAAHRLRITPAPITPDKPD